MKKILFGDLKNEMRSGKSAYEIWLDQGNTGTERDFLDSLKGEDGAAGKDGADGPMGPAGISVPLAGFFTVRVEGNGDLYVETADTNKSPLRYDPDTGDLYFTF